MIVRDIVNGKIRSFQYNHYRTIRIINQVLFDVSPIIMRNINHYKVLHSKIQCRYLLPTMFIRSLNTIRDNN